MIKRFVPKSPSLPRIVIEGSAANSRLFAATPASELQTLDRLSTLVAVPAGTNVVREAALGQQCVVVLEGTLDVERGGDRVATIGPGGFAGEMSMILGQRCNADVNVAEDGLAYVMNRGEFQTLLASCPSILRQVLTTTAQRLAAKPLPA